MGYASLTDLVNYGLPATALANLTTGQQQAAVDDASDIVNSYLNGRYQLPLLQWDTSITQATCVIAAYNLLSIRGYNPASGADVNIKSRYDHAISWLEQVQRQAAHPIVVQSPDPNGATRQPFVSSNSVIFTATGATAPSRGW